MYSMYDQSRCHLILHPDMEMSETSPVFHLIPKEGSCVLYFNFQLNLSLVTISTFSPLSPWPLVDDVLTRIPSPDERKAQKTARRSFRSCSWLTSDRLGVLHSLLPSLPITTSSALDQKEEIKASLELVLHAIKDVHTTGKGQGGRDRRSTHEEQAVWLDDQGES